MTNNGKFMIENSNGKYSCLTEISTDIITSSASFASTSPRWCAIPSENDIEVIINDDVTVVRNRKNKKKIVLRRCDLDEEDREKAILYGMLKLIGYKKAELDRIINSARDCRIKNDEESN